MKMLKMFEEEATTGEDGHSLAAEEHSPDHHEVSQFNNLKKLEHFSKEKQFKYLKMV